MVAVTVQPFAIGVCAFGVIFVLAACVHQTWAHVYFALQKFESTLFVVAQVATDYYLVVELPSVAIFYRASFLCAQNVPKRVVKVVVVFCLCNASFGVQAIFQTDIVGVVVEVSHYDDFCVGVQPGYRVF